ncbi:MAG: FAD-dependent oxidoreductase [Microthrixaceae bacterium]
MTGIAMSQHPVSENPVSDVVVLGSGAAGLTAALAAAVAGAKVTVLERAELVGGTTTLSAGVLWIPNNQLARLAGIEDSREQALEYLNSLSNDLIIPDLAEALVDGGVELVDFLHEHSGMRFQLVDGYPDYHPEKPGGMPRGGRSIEPALVSFRGLEDWVDRVAGEPRRLLCAEMPMGGGTGFLTPAEEQHRAQDLLEGLGRGLVGGLLRACLGKGVEILVGARGIELCSDGERISGVSVQVDSGTREVAASAVILATGGFDNDPVLVRDFLRGPMTHAVGVPTLTGDGLRMAMRVGAQLGNMSEAWWCPVVKGQGTRRDGGQVTYLSVRDRAVPGSIVVNRDGRRFVNEAASYNAQGAAFHELDAATMEYPNIPAYMVFDQAVVDRIGMLGLPPGSEMPGWVSRGDSLAELAGSVGVDAQGLTDTVERFNRYAREGDDPDFARGESAYDRWPGDQSAGDSPLSTLGPLEGSPFYAVEVDISALGTKGGPRTDRDGRVLDLDGRVIPGLYAAGNVMANPTGMIYGGAGATLAVAMVWGMFTGAAAVGDSGAS